MNIASRFQLFSIITKCIYLFSDSNVRKQIGFCRERISMLEGRRRRTGGSPKKAEEEARRKAMVVAPTSDEDQSSKDARTWRK
jgi:hypothetical protein